MLYGYRFSFNSTLYNITGSATPISAEEPGHLIVSFPGRPDGDYLVLDTDYTSYASVYACDQAGAFAFEYAWILGREQSMSAQLRVGVFFEELFYFTSDNYKQSITYCVCLTGSGSFQIHPIWN